MCSSDLLTLVALNPLAPFHDQAIQAAGLHFWIGGQPATYCPSSVPQTLCPPGNQTVLAGSGLSVLVPGGQQMYIQDNGAWAFTQAHSNDMYNVSYYGGGSGFVNGGYFGPNSTYWVACPVGQQWQVFANLPSVTFSESCLGFYALVVKVPGGTLGAWQYI